MRIIHRLIPFAALALAFTAADPAAAQRPHIPLSVEMRGGIALPREEFRVAADGGVAGEVSVTWHALPLAGVYGAYQRNGFRWDGVGGELMDTGFAAGVRINLPLTLIPIDPWIRAGIVAHQLEGGEFSEDAHTGWEAGAGLSLPLARGFTLTPGVLWTRFQHGGGGADGELLHVRHLRADVGVRLRM